MGMLDYLQDGENPGIIEETVYHLIAPIKQYGVTGFANETEAMSLFSILLGHRGQAAMLAGQTKGNLLLDTGMDKIYQLYKDCFGEQMLFSLKIDLALFVFTVLYLESPILRKEMKLANEPLKKEVFGSIHTLCEHYHPYLVRFPDILSFDNMKTLTVYLQNKGIS